MGAKVKVEFSDEVKEFLGLKKKRTRQIYASALRKFTKYYRAKYGDDKDLSHFLDRLDENQALPRRERKRVVEMELVEFIDGELEKGTADNTIRLSFSAVQGVLELNGFSLSAKYVGNLPRPREMKANKKHSWETEQIKEFMEKAPSYKDKAIILMMFQSGMGVGEVCSLDYGDVREQLEREKLPITITMGRKQQTHWYRTHMGADTVKYLKLYLETRGELKDEDPLFIKDRKRKGDMRITEVVIQTSFRQIAKGLSFVNVKDNDGINPARPHSLRAAFSYKMKKVLGKDSDFVEYWQGHVLPGTRMAYFKDMPDSDLEEVYMRAEHAVSVEVISLEVKVGRTDLEKEIRGEFDDRLGGLEGGVTALSKALAERDKEIDRLTETTRNLAERLGRTEAFVEMLGYDPDLETGEVKYDPEKDQRRD